ncbi:hypothetical protein B0H19DRAFT_629940 [Mycena capillaripes]|nr:hypothetical protein B0H19DRAFT_629940 [Mycena capillaripes]
MKTSRRLLLTVKLLSSPLHDNFQIPARTAQPSIFTPSPSTIFQPPAHLRHDHLSFYESSSQPILHLQIVQFLDEKTSIGLTIPECFCDAGGMKEILAAWSSILVKGGNTAGLPAIVEDTKILEKIVPEISSDEAPRSLWKHNLPSQLDASFDEEDTRWLFMPAETLAKLTQGCRDELALGTDQVQVSEGDVLLAWWAKVQTLFQKAYSTEGEFFHRPSTQRFRIHRRFNTLRWQSRYL